MKKVGKTTGPFKYDLNQITFFKNKITFDCTVEVRNRLKGLDLIDRVPDELWMEVCDIVHEMDQDHPHGKEMQKKRKKERKIPTSALFTMPKPLIVWITTNCGKFFTRWEYHTT